MQKFLGPRPPNPELIIRDPDTKPGQPGPQPEAIAAKPNPWQKFLGPRPPDTDFIKSALGPNIFAKARPGAQPNR